MAVTKFYPVADTNSGVVKADIASENWATARGYATGTSVNAGLTYGVQRINPTNIYLARGFVPTDTSALTASATITSATYNFKSWGFYNANIVHLFQSTQPTPGSLAVEDYNNINFTSGGSVNVTGAGWFSITLNATALTWINKTGTTLLGLTSAQDMNNAEPSDATDYTNFAYGSAAAAENKPYLEVTYTVPSTATGYAYFM